jgi:hypothetical protein
MYVAGAVTAHHHDDISRYPQIGPVCYACRAETVGGNFFVFWGVVAQEPRPPQGQAERFVDVLDREDGGRQPQESGAPINHRPREIVICTTFALPRRWSV